MSEENRLAHASGYDLQHNCIVHPEKRNVKLDASGYDLELITFVSESGDTMATTAQKTAHLKIFRGDADGGELKDYRVPVDPGMVVLDAVHRVQATEDADLAVRWNCKAGKCGSCGGEVNGRPRLMCMDRMDNYADDEPITIRPMATFPVIKDLVTDVSWNYRVNRSIPAFQPPAGEQELVFSQGEADRVQEFRKCIECFLCQNVCHVTREHGKFDDFGGPRFFVRVAGLEMHPRDTADRVEMLRSQLGIGYCNITKCCTEVCPESIAITDNAIIPLKERVADMFYDPLRAIWRRLFRISKPADHAAAESTDASKN